MTFYPAVDDDVTTDAPYRRRVGHEIELSGSATFRDKLYDLGVSSPPVASRYRGFHNPGCQCDEADDFPIHPLYDSSSSGGEYTIGGKRGVLYGSDPYYEAIDLLCGLVNEDNSGVYVDLRVGSHIHVSNVGVDGTDTHNLMHDNYERVQDDILLLARCEFDQWRSNGHVQSRLPRATDTRWDNPSRRSGGTVISDSRRGRPTYEFRVWNATVTPQTLHTNAAVSIALVETAIAGIRAESPSLLDLVGDHVPGACAEDVERRLARFSVADAA